MLNRQGEGLALSYILFIEISLPPSFPIEGKKGKIDDRIDSSFDTSIHDSLGFIA